MAQTRTFYGSLVGKKVVMAVSGVVLFAFLIGHLMGNLQIFVSREQLNAYAHFLKGLGELLWVVRIALLLALALHVIASIQVSLASWKARPVGYARKRDLAANYASRTMIVSGPLIFLYAIYHLMMFTFLTTGPGYSPTDVYANEIAAFGQPVISIVYIVAMVALGFHLYHGLWSMLQTLGASYSKYNNLRWATATGIAVAITVGYIAIPVAVLAGVIR